MLRGRQEMQYRSLGWKGRRLRGMRENILHPCLHGSSQGGFHQDEATLSHGSIPNKVWKQKIGSGFVRPLRIVLRPSALWPSGWWWFLGNDLAFVGMGRVHCPLPFIGIWRVPMDAAAKAKTSNGRMWKRMRLSDRCLSRFQVKPSKARLFANPNHCEWVGKRHLGLITKLYAPSQCIKR